MTASTQNIAVAAVSSGSNGMGIRMNPSNVSTCSTNQRRGGCVDVMDRFEGFESSMTIWTVDEE
jgi:hypothetical protein